MQTSPECVLSKELPKVKIIVDTEIFNQNELVLDPCTAFITARPETYKGLSVSCSYLLKNNHKYKY